MPRAVRRPLGQDVAIDPARLRGDSPLPRLKGTRPLFDGAAPSRPFVRLRRAIGSERGRARALRTSRARRRAGTHRVAGARSLEGTWSGHPRRPPFPRHGRSYGRFVVTTPGRPVVAGSRGGRPRYGLRGPPACCARRRPLALEVTALPAPRLFDPVPTVAVSPGAHGWADVTAGAPRAGPRQPPVKLADAGGRRRISSVRARRSRPLPATVGAGLTGHIYGRWSPAVARSPRRDRARPSARGETRPVNAPEGSGAAVALHVGGSLPLRAAGHGPRHILPGGDGPSRGGPRGPPQPPPRPSVPSYSRAWVHRRGRPRLNAVFYRSQSLRVRWRIGTRNRSSTRSET